MTIDFEVLCEDCALLEGMIHVRGNLTVQVKSDRVVIQRGDAEVTRATLAVARAPALERSLVPAKRRRWRSWAASTWGAFGNS